MQDVYKNIEEYIQSRKCIVLLAFDDIIADMISNKTPNLKVTELFTRGRKPNISFVFITYSYFKVPKDARLKKKKKKKKMKNSNQQKLQEIAFYHSLDIGYENFKNFYKECTAKPYSF